MLKSKNKLNENYIIRLAFITKLVRAEAMAENGNMIDKANNESEYWNIHKNIHRL